jgi:hypothetical protein
MGFSQNMLCGSDTLSGNIALCLKCHDHQGGCIQFSVLKTQEETILLQI